MCIQGAPRVLKHDQRCNKCKWSNAEHERCEVHIIKRYGEKTNTRKKIGGHNSMFNMRIEIQT